MDFKKTVYVVSDAPVVRLFVNGKETGRDSVAYHFLHVFENIAFEPGNIKAISYSADGKALSEHCIETTGKATSLRISNIKNHQLVADGADMVLLEIEALDDKGRRNPLATNMLHFSVEGPAEWIGGIGKDSHDTNCIRSKSLPLECGVNRVLLRSIGEEGVVRVNVTCDGMPASSITLNAKKDAANAPFEFVRSETPATPSYKDIKRTIQCKSATAGCNQQDAIRSYDDSEDTEWKNDGRMSTAWIRYELAEKARVDEVVLKLTGWRKREYPLQIFADDTLVWEGKTPVSLGYVHLPLAASQPAGSITIKLQGTASDSDKYGNIKELAAPVANELDLFKAKDGDKVRSELRIVECDLLQWIMPN